jgi:hypothetical protein
VADCASLLREGSTSGTTTHVFPSHMVVTVMGADADAQHVRTMALCREGGFPTAPATSESQPGLRRFLLSSILMLSSSANAVPDDGIARLQHS